MKEALYYDKGDSNLIKCKLCPQFCTIAEGKRGKCRVRKVEEGKLYATSYGDVSALNIDPIEKKPLYHFYPGSNVLSLGTVGCNLSCSFCQNHSIAQDVEAKTKKLMPKEAVEKALASDSIGIAYTYSEPLVWYEFIYETARLAQQAGLKNILVTNGMINKEPFKDLLQYIDAMNVDLKAFSNQFYKELCGGMLDPVKELIGYAAKQTHLEITTLLIPGHNDSEKMLEELSDWLAAIDNKIPLHFSRYFPRHQLREQITSIETLLRAKEIAEKKLDYVYLGNVPKPKHRNTYCPDCDAKIIERDAQITSNLDDKSCSHCGKKIDIVN